MEEILSSIRRVMAQEDAETEKAPRSKGARARAAASPTSETEGAEEEVLELTDTPQDESPTDTLADTEDALVSENGRAATRQSLSQLSAVIKPQPRSDMSVGTVSLDQMVQDMVRPMLKEWLDAHLPEIVERRVAREIARITEDKF